MNFKEIKEYLESINRTHILVAKEDIEISCSNPQCGSPNVKIWMNGDYDTVWIRCKKCNMEYIFILTMSVKYEGED